MVKENFLKQTFLMITSNDLTESSASNNRMLAMARGINDNGFRVIWYLLSSEVPNAIRNDDSYKNIIFVPLTQFYHGHNSIIVRHLTRLIAVKSIVSHLAQDMQNFDIRACMTIGDEFIFLMSYYYILRSYNVEIFHERTEYPYLFSGKSLLRKWNTFFYLRYFVPKVDHLFVISSSLRNLFSDLLSKTIPSLPISLLNMMVESDKYNDSCTNGKNATDAIMTRDIVYIGTMYGDKDGVHFLLSAFLKIKVNYPDIRLILIGENTRVDRMSKILSIIDPKDSSSNVVFTGTLNRLGISQYLKNAYCVALSRPSNIQAQYGFPTKLGEYLASGKPVIVTKVGDIPLFLKDGENAYLAEPDDVGSFAEKLCECLDDSYKSKMIGECGRKLANSVFNYKECARVVIKSFTYNE